MDELTVTPEYLEKLARQQDEARDRSMAAAGATSGVDDDVETSHGVISDDSNHAVARAERQRKLAAENIAKASAVLAQRLRDLEKTYRSVDDDLGWGIDRQVR